MGKGSFLVATFNFPKSTHILNFPFLFGTTIINDNQVASSIGCMKLTINNLSLSYLTIVTCNLDSICTWLDVPVVWLYPIQFGVEPTLVECLLDLCMFKQRLPCTFLAIPPTSAPFSAVNLNLLSPFEVLLNP